MHWMVYTLKEVMVLTVSVIFIIMFTSSINIVDIDITDDLSHFMIEFNTFISICPMFLWTEIDVVITHLSSNQLSTFHESDHLFYQIITNTWECSISNHNSFQIDFITRFHLFIHCDYGVSQCRNIDSSITFTSNIEIILLVFRIDLEELFQKGITIDGCWIITPLSIFVSIFTISYSNWTF